MKKRILLFCVLLIALTTAAVNARPAFPKRRLLKTSRLVLKARRGIERIEPLLLISYDLAKQAAYGSYSTSQRSQMDVEFQAILTMIDPTVDRAGFGKRNMLDSANDVITVNTPGEVLEFACVDITQAGLNLDEELSIAVPIEARTAFERIEASVRRIKEVDLQFTGYNNTLSRYLRNTRPLLDKEVQLGLEIMQASIEDAEIITTDLNRLIFLTEESINGSYSQQQRRIMDSELQDKLRKFDRIASLTYYGMGMIDSTDIVVIDTGDEILEFDCFDLTTAGLGLDGGISIDTPQNAQIAYPYLVDALQPVEEAIAALNDYVDTLLQYTQTKTNRGREN